MHVHVHAHVHAHVHVQVHVHVHVHVHVRVPGADLLSHTSRICAQQHRSAVACAACLSRGPASRAVSIAARVACAPHTTAAHQAKERA